MRETLQWRMERSERGDKRNFILSSHTQESKRKRDKMRAKKKEVERAIEENLPFVHVCSCVCMRARERIRRA